MQKQHVVVHLAAAVGVQLVLDEPVRTIKTTIHGTEVVLEAANRFVRPVLRWVWQDCGWSGRKRSSSVRR